MRKITRIFFISFCLSALAMGAEELQFEEELEGKYEFEKNPETFDQKIRLGNGRIAVVYLARDRKSKNLVAVRQVDKESNQSFVEQERKALGWHKACDHPHILKILDIYESQQFLSAVMPRMGMDLFDYILNHQPSGLPEPVARKYFVSLLSGLAYLHAKGIIHHDIKPENILLPCEVVEGYPDWKKIQITDLGFACRPEGGIVPASEIPRSGTSGYMAPEIVVGFSYTNRVDVYALGCVFYVILVGSFPFHYGVKGQWTDSEEKFFAISFREGQYCPSISLSPAAHQILRRIFRPLSQASERPTCEDLWTEFPWTKELSKESEE